MRIRMRTRVGMTAALLLSSVFFMSCASFAAMSEDEAYLAAMDSYNKKDFDKAGPLLADFYGKHPQSNYRPNVMLKLAELEQDFTRSEAMYKQVIKEKPDTEFEAEAVFSLAKLYYARAEYVKCVEYSGIIMGRFSNTMWIEPAYYYTMLSLNAQKKYQEAAGKYGEYSANSNYFMFKNRCKLAYAAALIAQGKCSEAIPQLAQVISELDREKYIYGPDVYAKIINCHKNSENIAELDKYIYGLKQKYPDSVEAKSGGFVKPVPTEAPVKQEPAKAVKQATAEVSVPEPTVEGGKFFTVQIGAYANRKFAEYDAEKLRKKKYYVFMKEDGKFIKVYVGKLATRQEAAKLAYTLSKKEGVKQFLVKQAWE
jgi:TolA-binding protein